MYSIQQGGGSCAVNQWAVLDPQGNQVGECFDDEAGAQTEADRLNGEADQQNSADRPAEWHAWVLPADLPSTDGREFASAGGGWRDLPLPTMLMTTNDWGHDGARAAALATTMEWRDGLVYAEGTYNQTPDGEELRGYVERGELRWVSADVADVGDVELYELLPDGTEVPYEVPDFMFFAEKNGRQAGPRRGQRLHEEETEQESGRIVERYLSWNVMGLTVLPFPAFPQCVIAPIDVPLPDAAAAAQDAAAGLGMTSNSSRRSLAASGSFPVEPPAAWFENPAFGEVGVDDRLAHDEMQDLWACPLTITSDGRVFGHLAPWEECHIGYQDVCMTAPTSLTNYAYFMRRPLRTAEGADVAVGQITLTGGHPDLSLGWNEAQAHYDDTRSAVADVACGDDAYGVWIAGAVRPGVTEEQLRILRASSLSGDWRPIGAGLELVAAACVNVPGFMGTRRLARVADGRQLALVSAGTAAMARLKHEQGWHHAYADLARRIELIDARTSPLRSLAASALRDQARG